MISGGFFAAYRILAPEFQVATGHTVTTASGLQWGNTRGDSQRLKRGELADVLIMVGSALDDLVKEGKVVSGSASIWRDRKSAWRCARAAEAGHRHRRGVQAHRARGEVDRVFGQRQRRLSVHGAVPKLGIAEQIAGKSR